jgi:16S rRNA (cytosine1402-N4)-methyltransferase
MEAAVIEAVHTPVLLEETMALLGPRHGGELMVDATLGEGGHSYAFLSRFPDLRILGIDADREIQAVAKERLQGFGGRVSFYTGWSQDFFTAPGADKPDTILMDLGVSRYHYEKGERGFSFMKDEPLDMRIDTTRGQSAAELITRLPEKELADLLYRNAEERYSRRIARSITRVRGTIGGSAALARLVVDALPPGLRHRPVHPATRTFQALRIAVNHELEGLPGLLDAALGSLGPGGRMGVISFHSLEDRIVKRFFRDRAASCTSIGETPICRKGEKEPGLNGQRVNILTKKGLSPGEEEVRANPASRSARLRVVEKI